MKAPELKTIPNPGVTLVEYEPSFTATCELSGIPFHGVLLISYEPNELLLELLSFENYLAWAATRGKATTTIEDFTHHIFGILKYLLKPHTLVVQLTAETLCHAPVVVTVASHKRGST